MKLINCIIVEDEPLAMERMERFVAKVTALNLVQTFDNGIDALLYLKQNPIDILFLDINLGEMSGVQLAEQITNQTAIIFTTAYPEYAIKGFELNITDYLLKPFAFDRFYQSIERAIQRLEKYSEPLKIPTFLFIKTEYRLEKVNIEDILFIEGMGDYRRIHTKSTKIMTLQTFKDFELDLKGTSICRVHKSFMVNIQHLKSIERDRIYIQEKVIPISETYKVAFNEKLRG